MQPSCWITKLRGDLWNPSHGWVDCVRGGDGWKGMEKGRGRGKERVRLGLGGGREARVGVGDGWVDASVTDCLPACLPACTVCTVCTLYVQSNPPTIFPSLSFSLLSSSFVLHLHLSSCIFIPPFSFLSLGTTADYYWIVWPAALVKTPLLVPRGPC